MKVARVVIAGLVGAVFAVLFVLVNGMLQTQIWAAESGVQLNWSGEIATVVGPHIAYIAMLGVVAVSLLTLLALGAIARVIKTSERFALAIAFGGVSTGLVIWSLMDQDPAATFRPEDGNPVFAGWSPWIASATDSTVVYVLPLLFLAALCTPRLWRRPAERSTSERSESETELLQHDS